MESRCFKKIGSVMFFSFLLFLSLAPNTVFAQDNASLVLYFFWGEGCPHCATEKPFLEELQQKYPQLEVRPYETWRDAENAKLFADVAKEYGTTAQGVPTTFLGDKYWVGFASSIGREIEAHVEYCVQYGCSGPLDKPAILPQTNGTCVHVFLHGACPQCQNLVPYFDSLNEKYGIELKTHDVSSPEEMDMYGRFKEIYGLSYGSYPIVFIGDTVLIGETVILETLENEIIACNEGECVCPTQQTRGFTPQIPKPPDYTAEEGETIAVPFFGEIDLSSMPLLGVTVLIAFVDGLNPCSLWVLAFLLGIAVNTRSRKKILIVGMTFLTVTAAAYGLFIAGLLSVFSYIMYLAWIKVVVALLAFLFAIVNIKDYFWYKKGISFTIPDSYKPKMFREVRGVMKSDLSTFGMIGGTVVMALGIALVELPCTAGFPIVWTSIVAKHSIDLFSYAFLLLAYLAVYLSLEMIIFLVVLFTLQTSRFEETHGRIIKLIGGMIMLALAIVLLVAPEMMNDLGGALAIFGFAFAASLAVILLHRKILPAFGIRIGMGEKPGGQDGKAQQKDKTG